MAVVKCKTYRVTSNGLLVVAGVLPPDLFIIEHYWLFVRLVIVPTRTPREIQKKRISISSRFF